MKFPMTVSRARIVNTIAIIIIWVRLYGDDGGPWCTGSSVVVTFVSPAVTLLELSRLRNVVYADMLKLMLLSVVKWVISECVGGLCKGSSFVSLSLVHSRLDNTYICAVNVMMAAVKRWWMMVRFLPFSLFVPTSLNSPKRVLFLNFLGNLSVFFPPFFRPRSGLHNSADTSKEIYFLFKVALDTKSICRNGFKFQHIGYWTSVRVWLLTVIIILTECSIWE